MRNEERPNRPLMVDSYKSGQFQQVPAKTTYMHSYFESRGSGRGYKKTVFFGMQYFLKKYFTNPIEMWEIEEAKEIFDDRNEPFNYEGWKRIVTEFGGKLPIRVSAVAEGSVVPTGNVLFTVESLHEDFAWVPDYVETAFVRAGWYGTTVATQSYYLRELIYKFLQETADDPDAEIGFKLHDFGARGASSTETAEIGGAAHLTIFRGSDTVEGVRLLKNYYGEFKGMSNSIPASQHSTISSWQREGEVDAYRNMLNLYKGNGIFACVSDTWNIYDACEKLWGGELRQEVIDSGALVVIRPDSGDPVDVLFGKTPYGRDAEGGWDDTGRLISKQEEKGVFGILGEKFGYTINSKGYKVLNYVRVIQGDGVNPDSIEEILTRLEADGWSATNIAFGMGGALLQKVDRDTMKMAYKCSAAVVDGQMLDVYKDPITDKGKMSKKGLVHLYKDSEGYFTTNIEPDKKVKLGIVNALDVIYENGIVNADAKWSEIRERATLKKDEMYDTIGT
jgi:nicotinamide phosphoribosyltransferase